MQYAGWRLGRAASINSGVNRSKLRPSWSLYPNDNGDGATTQAALQMEQLCSFHGSLPSGLTAEIQPPAPLGKGYGKGYGSILVI